MNYYIGVQSKGTCILIIEELEINLNCFLGKNALFSFNLFHVDEIGISWHFDLGYKI